MNLGEEPVMLAAREPLTELQHSNLSAVHRALQRHRSVKAAIMVQATGAGGRRENYHVIVTLSWR